MPVQLRWSQRTDDQPLAFAGLGAAAPLSESGERPRGAVDENIEPAADVKRGNSDVIEVLGDGKTAPVLIAGGWARISAHHCHCFSSRGRTRTGSAARWGPGSATMARRPHQRLRITSAGAEGALGVGQGHQRRPALDGVQGQGLAADALAHWTKPRYDPPKVPMLPSHQGCARSQATVSAPSLASLTMGMRPLPHRDPRKKPGQGIRSAYAARPDTVTYPRRPVSGPATAELQDQAAGRVHPVKEGTLRASGVPSLTALVRGQGSSPSAIAGRGWSGGRRLTPSNPRALEPGRRRSCGLVIGSPSGRVRSWSCAARVRYPRRCDRVGYPARAGGLWLWLCRILVLVLPPWALCLRWCTWQAAAGCQQPPS
jgi:hypothetical protein